MKILAIETSCDETAIALVSSTQNENPSHPSQLGNISILGNTVASQAELHAQYGGVFPAMAKREHAKNILPVLISTLNQANIETTNKVVFNDGQKDYLKNLFTHEAELYELFINELPNIDTQNIDYIAVTTGPGLEPALWVGVNFAKALSFVWGIPVIPINHMEGHILSPLLATNCKLPALALLISGGHTELVQVHGLGNYTKIGQTLDDAVGEAFDKVARLLGLPYPGGPHISKLAQIERVFRQNNPNIASENDITLPRPMLHSDNLDFSFSGLKTAVLYLVKKLTEVEPLTEKQKQEIAFEFENSVTEVLVVKTLKAIKQNQGTNPIETILVGGGVSANTFIRESLTKAIKEYSEDIVAMFPEQELSTDNAIMIAMAAISNIQNTNHLDGEIQKTKTLHDIVAQGNWEL